VHRTIIARNGKDVASGRDLHTVALHSDHFNDGGADFCEQRAVLVSVARSMRLRLRCATGDRRERRQWNHHPGGQRLSTCHSGSPNPLQIMRHDIVNATPARSKSTISLPMIRVAAFGCRGRMAALIKINHVARQTQPRSWSGKNAGQS
jgi:hypothetical protein